MSRNHIWTDDDKKKVDKNPCDCFIKSLEPMIEAVKLDSRNP